MTTGPLRTIRHYLCYSGKTSSSFLLAFPEGEKEDTEMEQTTSKDSFNFSICDVLSVHWAI